MENGPAYPRVNKQAAESESLLNDSHSEDSHHANGHANGNGFHHLRKAGRSPSNMPSYYPLQDGTMKNRKRGFTCSFNVVCFIVAICIVVGYALSFLFFKPRPEYTVERHNGQWRTGDIVDIPQRFTDLQDHVEITEGYVTIDLDRNLHVHALFALPPGKPDGRFTVLFLHGAKFSSETWRKLGSLNLVAALGLRAIAIDMPGHGRTPKESEIPDFLASVVKALKIERPVVVAPSKSGIYAMPYMMTPDPETADTRMRGFIPIAPAGTHSYHHGDLNRVDVPTMILMGERDYDIGRHATADLRAMSNAEPLIVMDAGHACYLDKPDVWHRFLYNFLISIDPAILKPAAQPPVSQ